MLSTPMPCKESSSVRSASDTSGAAWRHGDHHKRLPPFCRYSEALQATEVGLRCDAASEQLQQLREVILEGQAGAAAAAAAAAAVQADTPAARIARAVELLRSEGVAGRFAAHSKHFKSLISIRPSVCGRREHSHTKCQRRKLAGVRASKALCNISRSVQQ